MNKHVVLLQFIFFLASLLIPLKFADWWADHHRRPLPRPAPDDRRLEDKERSTHERHRKQIEEAKWKVDRENGKYIGYVLELCVLAFILWGIPSLFR